MLSLRRSRHLLAALAFLTGGLATLPASACSLALVVAMDGSSSVDEGEHELQLSGLANALSDPEVIEAIQVVGGIWFSSFEWSGRYQQTLQIDWHFLKEEDTILQAARTLSAAPRRYTEFPTALGYALGYASNMLRRVPERCLRKVVDVAGDGINNEGFDALTAYRAFSFDGVTVNALAIAGADPDPVSYYRDKVIRGPNSFVEVARGFPDYQSAMKRKLLREIGSRFIAGLPSGTSVPQF